jgi:hypothetical protein
MDESKYGRLIVTDARVPSFPPENEEKMKERMKKIHSTMKTSHILWLDNDVVEGSSFYMDILWHWSGSTQGSPEQTHVHEYDELIGFIGSNRENPEDLGAEIEIWLGGEKHMLTKTCLIFIPKGLTHAPIIFRRIDTPFLGFTLMARPKYVRSDLEE